MRRIDVGVDGGREAAAALTLAVRLAARPRARLRLVGVAEIELRPRRHAAPRRPARAGRDSPATSTHAADGLRRHRGRGRAARGPRRRRSSSASPREADLLVLGSRATYGGAGEVALGDVGKRILRAAPCPTLVVPAP